MRPFEILRYLLFPLLILPSYLYLFIVHVRNLLYDFGIFKSVKTGIPVISVGNISAGGSGKSPFTIWLAEELQKKGYKPAILSRGYSRKSKGLIVVSDGEKCIVSARLGGDEPVMMAKKLNGVPVVVDENRVRGALFIKEKYSPDCVILDDALQHRRIYRDVDIALWDVNQTKLDLFPLPAGHRRDTMRRLREIDLLFLTKIKNPDNPVNHHLLKKYHSIDGMFQYKTGGIYSLKTGEEIVPKNVRKAVAFAGIARPQAFFSAVKFAYPDIQWFFIPLSDHAEYDSNFFLTLESKYPGFDIAVTTEKDLVKLPEPYDDRLCVAGVELEPIGDINPVEKIISGFAGNHP